MSISPSDLNLRARQAVEEYKAHQREPAADELGFYAAMPSLRKTIDCAARACTSWGGKHPHQQRLPRAALQEFAEALSTEVRSLCQARLFDEVHGMVSEVGESIRDIGELAVYDTALRIGAKLAIEPTRVYLHRGTRVGATALGVGIRQSSVEVADLPRVFRQLKPHEIEDCLCIFKDFLSGKKSLEEVGCGCRGKGCNRPRRKKSGGYS